MKLSCTVLNIEAVTGFGKTVIMLESLKRIMGGSNKALVIVSRREIAADVLRMARDAGVGDRVYACTVQSARRTMADHEPAVVVTLELYAEQEQLAIRELEHAMTVCGQRFAHINVSGLGPHRQLPCSWQPPEIKG